MNPGEKTPVSAPEKNIPKPVSSKVTASTMPNNRWPNRRAASPPPSERTLTKEGTKATVMDPSAVTRRRALGVRTACTPAPD